LLNQASGRTKRNDGSLTPDQNTGASLRPPPSTPNKGLPTLTKHDEAHRNTIGRLAKERVAEMERLTAELAETKAAEEQLRRQYVGATSRRKVVEDEVRADCACSARLGGEG